MPGEFAFLDELVEDVFDLLARYGRGIEVFEDPLEVHPAIRRLLNIFDEIVSAEVRLRLPPRSTTARVLQPHQSSLLTSPIEEHRFDCLWPKWRNWQTH